MGGFIKAALFNSILLNRILSSPSEPGVMGLAFLATGPPVKIQFVNDQ